MVTGFAAEIWERASAASAADIATAAGISVAGIVVTVLATAAVLVRLPPDYFVATRKPLPLAGHTPALRWTAVALRNLAGAALVVLGILLSLPGIPGQGLLTILLGVMLLDVPGKRRLEGAILRRRPVHRAINGLRARFQKPPILVPPSPST